MKKTIFWAVIVVVVVVVLILLYLFWWQTPANNNLNTSGSASVQVEEGEIVNTDDQLYNRFIDFIADLSNVVNVDVSPYFTIARQADPSFNYLPESWTGSYDNIQVSLFDNNQKGSVKVKMYQNDARTHYVIRDYLWEYMGDNWYIYDVVGG